MQYAGAASHRRLQEGEFAFDDQYDVWRLLATMTFCKARNLVKLHQRGRRDVRRETLLDADAEQAASPDEATSPPGAGDMALLLECLECLLEKLSEHDREIVLRRLEGDSIKLVARKVQRSRRTVLRVLAHVQEMGAPFGGGTMNAYFFVVLYPRRLRWQATV